jgi:hypothetical protein
MGDMVQSINWPTSLLTSPPHPHDFLRIMLDLFGSQPDHAEVAFSIPRKTARLSVTQIPVRHTKPGFCLVAVTEDINHRLSPPRPQN